MDKATILLFPSLIVFLSLSIFLSLTTVTLLSPFSPSSLGSPLSLYVALSSAEVIFVAYDVISLGNRSALSIANATEILARL